MSRIATNIGGIERTLLNRMAEANAAATLATLRMSTMQKINAPSDDPSGFVTLSGFQTQLSRLHRGDGQRHRRRQHVISQAQTAVGQIADQLNTIRGELLNPQSDSQAKIDAAIVEINQLSQTDVGGRRLLDGSADFNTSGAQPGQVAQLSVYAMPGGTQTISGRVVTAAQQATLRYTGVDGKVNGGATLTITGSLGGADHGRRSAVAGGPGRPGQRRQRSDGRDRLGQRQ